MPRRTERVGVAREAAWWARSLTASAHSGALRALIESRELRGRDSRSPMPRSTMGGRQSRSNVCAERPIASDVVDLAVAKERARVGSSQSRARPTGVDDSDLLVHPHPSASPPRPQLIRWPGNIRPVAPTRAQLKSGARHCAISQSLPHSRLCTSERPQFRARRVRDGQRPHTRRPTKTRCPTSDPIRHRSVHRTARRHYEP